MRIIRDITGYIDEEMDGVCEYIKFASAVKGHNDAVFNTVMEIIPQELEHIELWHNVAVREISKMKAMLAQQGKEVPPYMLEMWQDEHSKYVEDMAKIKYKIEVLKR